MNRGKVLIEDYPIVARLSDFKAAAGGPEGFRRTSHFTVDLPDGRSVRVDLVDRSTNLGLKMRLLACPMCSTAVRNLRWAPIDSLPVETPGLVCGRCLRRLGGRYAAQDRRRRSRGMSPAIPLGESRDALPGIDAQLEKAIEDLAAALEEASASSS